MSDLIGLVDGKDSTVRDSAIQTLGLIGPAAKTAVPLLVDVCKTGDFMSRGAAGQALKKINPAEARRAGVK